jgi:hypothetical protein
VILIIADILDVEVVNVAWGEKVGGSEYYDKKYNRPGI